MKILLQSHDGLLYVGALFRVAASGMNNVLHSNDFAMLEFCLLIARMKNKVGGGHVLPLYSFILSSAFTFHWPELHHLFIQALSMQGLHPEFTAHHICQPIITYS